MPTSLGYQPNYGIGGQQFSTVQGDSIQPEVNTIKQNQIPNALNKLQKGSSFAINALKDIVPAQLGTSIARAGAHRAGQTVTQIAPDVLPAAGGHASNIVNVAAEQGAQEGAKIAGKATLGTLGKITAGIGTIYGLTDMGIQLAHNQDARSAGDMRNTLATNTYTTDLGNTYTTHSGLDRTAELNYANAEKTRKNLEFTTASIGTGMSAGALLGATVGSIAPGVGTAIGAGVGALGGLLAYGLGFGDTEEKTKQAASDLADSISMEDKMSKSIALSQDAKQGFYGRTKSGSLGAACGKKPIHARNGKGNAMVSHGEVIGNLNEGWAYREPGVPDNNDTLKRHIAKDDFVISNKYGLSDYAASTGDLVGALQLQDMLMKYNRGKGYKCGKLPKLEGGYWDKALMAIPNVAQILAATQQYNIDKNMPVQAPRRIADYSPARNQAYALLGDQIGVRPYMNVIDDDVARNKYAISRMPGMGMGGRAVMIDAASAAGLNAKMKQMLSIDEHNAERRKAARNLMATINTHEQDIENQNFADYANRYAQANAAKYNALAQDRKNMVHPLGALFKDMSDLRKYEEAKALKQQEMDQQWLNHYLNGDNDTPSSTLAPYLKLNTPVMTPQLNRSKYNFNDISTWPEYQNLQISQPQVNLPRSMQWLQYKTPGSYTFTIPQYKFTYK